MTVYNVGLPRTATRSIDLLFKQIGFNTKHALQNHDNYKFDIDHFLKNEYLFKKTNTFYSDTPVWNPIFWEVLELKKAKIIHTFRDKESWVNSVQKFNYFKQQNYFPQDKFWFKGYFDRIDKHYLSNVYDDHIKQLNYFDNVLSIDVINQSPGLIIDKICSHLNIERKSHYELPVIGKNTHKKSVVN